ncbi:MAG: Smr/MutS family protein [Verrucomicrobiota bacterium]
MPDDPTEPDNPGPAEGDDEAVEIPIDGTLDLHTFRPKEVKDLVPDYLDACGEKGIFVVRIVHGKGTGALRDYVHRVLKRHPDVISFRLGDERTGGWGATLVTLRPTSGGPCPVGSSQGCPE